ncbi:hypothetical protein MRX96_009229 [Rhipicephalus microplus]
MSRLAEENETGQGLAPVARASSDGDWADRTFVSAGVPSWPPVGGASPAAVGPLGCQHRRTRGHRAVELRAKLLLGYACFQGSPIQGYGTRLCLGRAEV